MSKQWANELRERAKDAKSVMRLHALSLLCFADDIETDVAEAIQKGGHLTYTIQVTQDIGGEDDKTKL